MMIVTYFTFPDKCHENTRHYISIRDEKFLTVPKFPLHNGRLIEYKAVLLELEHQIF